MSNRDHLPPNERLRALYRRFCEDQNFYARCRARSLAETAAYNVRTRFNGSVASVKLPTKEDE